MRTIRFLWLCYLKDVYSLFKYSGFVTAGWVAVNAITTNEPTGGPVLLGMFVLVLLIAHLPFIIGLFTEWTQPPPRRGDYYYSEWERSK